MAKEKEPGEGKKDSWLKNKYRVTAYNDTTLEQVWHFRISGIGAIVLGAALTVIIIATVTILIAFTGLREFIPGYPDDTTREKIMINALRADSLERALLQWERQLNNINLLMSGKEPLPLNNASIDSIRTTAAAERVHARSHEDSLLRKEVEERDRYNPAAGARQGTMPQLLIENLFFFPPVQGVVSDVFNVKTNHLAIDVVTVPHAPVMSVLDGTVIMATWTVETGYVLQIQHAGDLISIYKHNERLLKKQGDHVKAGETIAIVGNSGELTTGPHLHFELWYKGAPVDPLKYIKF